MALHIIPAGEPHQSNPKCSCRPRHVRYARRMAWRHNVARPSRARVAVSAKTRGVTINVHPSPHVRVELIRQYGFTPADIDRMEASRIRALMASLPRRAF